ncbi:CAP domain-containing protein [Marinobacter halodurans]|nr:CAP domain-containing protein [Marinobacter halodurans]
MSADCKVDQYQADLIELINIARSEARMCGDDHYEATTPVTYNCTLEGAARVHSEDMETHNFFSHTGSDGLTVGNRVTATGYQWSIVGENIAAGFDTPASVTAGWLDSPGHCRNIMDPRFEEFAAVRVDSTSAANDYSNYWTSVYARPH